MLLCKEGLVILTSVRRDMCPDDMFGLQLCAVVTSLDARHAEHAEFKHPNNSSAFLKLNTFPGQLSMLQLLLSSERKLLSNVETNSLN